MDKKFSTYTHAHKYAVKLARKLRRTFVYIYSYDAFEYYVSLEKHHWAKSHIARSRTAHNSGKYAYIKVIHFFHKDVYPKKLMKFMDKLGEF
jgi:hypothetical protein